MIKDFMAQAGDITSAEQDGRGGESIYGPYFDDD